MNWYKIAQNFPSWFIEEIATETENINIAINKAQSDPNKEFEGVNLQELQNSKTLLSKDPIEYFRTETYRHNYMCLQLQIHKVKGYEQHCQLGNIYGGIYSKITKWQHKLKQNKTAQNESWYNIETSKNTTDPEILTKILRKNKFDKNKEDKDLKKLREMVSKNGNWYKISNRK